VLKEANIDLSGVFMNADSGFLAESCGDAQVLREQCSEKQIEVNIHINERNNKEQPSDKYVYFDELLFKRRFVIERMNTWIDSFSAGFFGKALLIRFETSTSAWMALHFLAFTVILCRKITNY